jgi:AAA+ superfamily predicted ATPase
MARRETLALSGTMLIAFLGPPGVGKTLTAELGARAARRPLYKVGATDIGLNPEDAERSFSRLFQLASRWQAVLLM